MGWDYQNHNGNRKRKGIRTYLSLRRSKRLKSIRSDLSDDLSGDPSDNPSPNLSNKSSNSPSRESQKIQNGQSPKIRKRKYVSKRRRNSSWGVSTKTNPDDLEKGTMIKLGGTNMEDDINDWNKWVAATSTRNYILDDGILDVLKIQGSVLTKVNTNYQDQFIKTIGNPNSNNFVTSIMNQGIKFERKVIKLIKEKIGQTKFINIGGDHNPRSREKYLNTLKAMNKGIPVIYQGLLRNYKNKTYGIPDLLIRSDYIHKLVKKDPISDTEKHRPASSIQLKKGKKYHYIVIDIKFKTLHLKTDGQHLRNDGPMKAYKSQLYIYNQALGEMQGYEPPAAFIMGWKWKYVNKKTNFQGNNCFDRLGRIDYKVIDKDYTLKTDEAIKWVLNVRQNAHKWDLSQVPLPHEALYPNMCNRYDYPYHNLKKTFAQDIGEITLIWKCGPKERRKAHENGIYSWKDPDCTPENLGITGEYTQNIVGRILEANNHPSFDPYEDLSNELSNDPSEEPEDQQFLYPKYITNNFGDWKNKSKLEFFVDFEMTCSVFTDFETLPVSDSSSLIFTIGVGYNHPKTGEWIFRDFTVDRLERSEEYKICQEFVEYILSTTEEYGDRYNDEPPSLYHWSPAEPSAWKRAILNNWSMIPRPDNWRRLNWVDLLKVFQKEPIGIKGCLNYSLKTVVRTFKKHGLIDTVWDTGSGCADGADAAVGAYRVDRETRQQGVSFKSDPLAQEIIKYNEIDCKVLSEILMYLRENHIDPEDGSLDILSNPNISPDYETPEKIEPEENITPMIISSDSSDTDDSDDSSESSDSENLCNGEEEEEDDSSASYEEDDSEYIYSSAEDFESLDFY